MFADEYQVLSAGLAAEASQRLLDIPDWPDFASSKHEMVVVFSTN
jgi:hypothetical protein